jgi:hypothetical protein
MVMAAGARKRVLPQTTIECARACQRQNGFVSTMSLDWFAARPAPAAARHLLVAHTYTSPNPFFVLRLQKQSPEIAES